MGEYLGTLAYLVSRDFTLDPSGGTLGLGTPFFGRFLREYQVPKGI